MQHSLSLTCRNESSDTGASTSNLESKVYCLRQKQALQTPLAKARDVTCHMDQSRTPRIAPHAAGPKYATGLSPLFQCRKAGMLIDWLGIRSEATAILCSL